MSDDAQPNGRLSTVEALARLGAGAWLRTARWGVETSLRTGAQVLEVFDRDGRVTETIAGLLGASTPEPPPTLRERGESLLRASANVGYEQGSHPAYERILADLAPDEARILRLIAERGPQPAVDVRTGVAFVPGSRLVAQGYSMVGAEAGCRFTNQVPAYLSNLHRLGLIWFSREPVPDNERYQVLEVQPDVSEALEQAGRFSHIVRRSIRMTPLGRDFCEAALSLSTAEIEALAPGVEDRSN
jgi:hypothetical protein